MKLENKAQSQGAFLKTYCITNKSPETECSVIIRFKKHVSIKLYRTDLSARLKSTNV